MQAFHGSLALHDKENYRIAQRKVKSLYSEIQKLHKCMNGLVPISRIPNEILEIIFEKLQEPESDVEPDESPFSWISVTHVCSRWRAVALHARTLWAQPFMSNISMAETMLDRSKDALLTIRAKIGDGRYGLKSSYSTVEIEALSACFSDPRHLERIRSLSISNIDNTMIGLREMPALPINPPKLESLRLIGRPDIPPTKCACPDLLVIPTYNLREIEFSNVKVIWTSPLFQYLTHLKLDHTVPDESFEMFLVLKRLAPRLLVLHISNSLPIVTNDEWTPYHSPPINFEHLNELLVSTEISEMICFFLSICILPSTIVNLRIAPRTDAQHILKLFMNLGSGYTPPLSTVDFRSLIVTDNYLNNNTNCFSLQFYTKAMEKISPNAQWSLYFEYSKHFPLQVESIFRSLHISRLLNIQGISHFHLNLPKTDHHALGSTLFTLDGVTFLKVYRHTSMANAVSSALAQTCRPDSDRKIPLPCPSLGTIHFEDVVCDLGALERCLVKRVEYGLAIQRLSISRCHGVKEDDLPPLREIIIGGEVFWDENDWSTYRFKDATSYHLHKTEMFNDKHDMSYVPSEEDDTDTDEESDDDEDNGEDMINEIREELERLKAS